MTTTNGTSAIINKKRSHRDRLKLHLLVAMTIECMMPLSARTADDIRYRLGPGDRIQVRIYKAEGFDSTVSVLPDGTISLPRIPLVKVEGLDIDQARKRVENAYRNVLRHPVAYIDLVDTRAQRISVTGEVQRPGLYSMGPDETNSISSISGSSATEIRNRGWPTLVEAIQKAGGLTPRGDLRRVTLVRRSGPTGKAYTREINYWEAIRQGEQVENPLVFDGDSIRIYPAKEQKEEELIAVAATNFAPPTISVNVVGEVLRPGPQVIRTNSPLSQAILAAGGLSLRAEDSNIELLSLLPNGSIKAQRVQYKPQASLGDANNPPLRDGDVIVVDRHLWAKATDRLKAVIEPLGPVLNAASIFRLFAL